MPRFFGIMKVDYKLKVEKMGKIFIAHAWSNDENYNQKQLDFIRKLELELQDNNLEVIYDGNNVDKKGLNSFMRENIKNCDVILAICDEIYLQKSDNEDTEFTMNYRK